MCAVGEGIEAGCMSFVYIFEKGFTQLVKFKYLLIHTLPVFFRDIKGVALNRSYIAKADYNFLETH